MTVGKTTREFLMKRNKIIAVAVVVMMMVGGLVLASCASCPGSGDCKASDTATWCGVNDPTDVDVLKCAAAPLNALSNPDGKCDC